MAVHHLQEPVRFLLGLPAGRDDAVFSQHGNHPLDAGHRRERDHRFLPDEPSLGLAPTVVDELFDALGEIRERGVTILIVEQRALLRDEIDGQHTRSLVDDGYVHRCDPAVLHC